MDGSAITTAKASYHRCAASPDFLPAFYRNFFQACPAAEPLFATTDFTRQVKLLSHAIGLLLIFPQEHPQEPNPLTRLAEKHGPAGLKIDPAWYPLFMDSLVLTASQFDPEFSPALGQAWRDALRPGIEYMARGKEG